MRIGVYRYIASCLPNVRPFGCLRTYKARQHGLYGEHCLQLTVEAF